MWHVDLSSRRGAGACENGGSYHSHVVMQGLLPICHMGNPHVQVGLPTTKNLLGDCSTRKASMFRPNLGENQNDKALKACNLASQEHQHLQDK